MSELGLLLLNTGTRGGSTWMRWKYGLMEKGTACVRSCNLSAILICIVSSALEGTTHFSVWLSGGHVLCYQYKIFLFVLLFLLVLMHIHTDFLLYFIHVRFSVSNLYSWDPWTLLIFKMEIAIIANWMRRMSLKRKSVAAKGGRCISKK